MREKLLSVVAVMAILIAAVASASPLTVVDYFNELPKAPYLKDFPHNEPLSMNVHKTKTGWEVKDTNYGADMIPVTVDIKNGYLSFNPLSGDSQMQVEAALFRREGGAPLLLVNVSNSDEARSQCAVTAYDFSSGKPVDVTVAVMPGPGKGSCYALPRVGTMVTVTTANHKKLDLKWDKGLGQFIK